LAINQLNRINQTLFAGRNVIMSKISLSEFNELKVQIKVATTPEQFNALYILVTSYCPDSNILALAQLFNSQVRVQLPSFNSFVQLIDTDHISILIDLQESASAVKKHIAYSGYELFLQADPLSFNLHITEMNNRIEELKDNKNYSYYCQYYLENVFFPYASHHPKINLNPPSCVAELLVRYKFMEQSVTVDSSSYAPTLGR
jgi:hypothetical protein